MERNDATIPSVALVVAAIFWVILLFLFTGSIKEHEEANKPAPVVASASADAWKTEGAKLYAADCAGCHGAAGQGGVGPTFVGNKNILANMDYSVHMLEKGKGIMPAFPQLGDEGIQNVANYIRNSWGNKAELITPAYFEAKKAGANDAALKQRSRFVPDHLALPEIFLATFVMVLTIYGVIGLYSVWAEGEQLVPGIHQVKSTGLAMAGMFFSLGMTVLCAVLFIKQIMLGLNGLIDQTPIVVTNEGLYAAGQFIFITIALGLYKKYFMDGEVLVEDAAGEFPW